jgi:hypothetical protein
MRMISKLTAPFRPTPPPPPPGSVQAPAPPPGPEPDHRSVVWRLTLLVDGNPIIVNVGLAHEVTSALDRGLMELETVCISAATRIDLQLTAQIEGTAERCPASAAGGRCLRRAGHNDDHTTGAIRWSG